MTSPTSRLELQHYMTQAACAEVRTASPSTSPNHQRRMLSTPFASNVIARSLQRAPTPSGIRRQSSFEGRIILNATFFEDILAIFATNDSPSPSPRGLVRAIHISSESSLPICSNPNHSQVNALLDIFSNLKEGADEAWIKMFTENLEAMKCADSSENFRTKLRKLLIDFHFENSLVKKMPDYFLSLLRDLREFSLRDLRNKYFSMVEYSKLSYVSALKESKATERRTANSHLPITTLFQIFNMESPIDIATMIQKEEEEIIDDISKNQCSDKVIKKDEALRLLIHLKAEKRKKTRRHFSANVMTISNIAPFIDGLKQDPACGDYQRFQIICRSPGNHYTALDLEFREKAWTCFIMDASASGELETIKKSLRSVGIQTIIEAYTPMIKGEQKELQSDDHSCWTFAFDHAAESSKIENLFSLLRKMPSTTRKNAVDLSLSWFDLPPQFLKNAQSTDLINAYASRYPETYLSPYKKYPSLKDFFDSKIQEVEIKGSRKAVNVSVVLSTERKKRKIRLYLKRVSSSQVFTILSNIPCTH
jgi:hypothetical protein